METFWIFFIFFLISSLFLYTIELMKLKMLDHQKRQPKLWSLMVAPFQWTWNMTKCKRFVYIIPRILGSRTVSHDFNDIGLHLKYLPQIFRLPPVIYGAELNVSCHFNQHCNFGYQLWIDTVGRDFSLPQISSFYWKRCCPTKWIDHPAKRH